MNISKEASLSLYVVKAFAILSVICAHMPFGSDFPTLDTVRDCLGQIGVGTFFFSSGFLYNINVKKEKQYFFKKAKYIVLPWLLISTLIFVLFKLVFQPEALSVLSILKNFLGIGTHYWYMTVLIILFVLFAFFKKRWQLILCCIATLFSVLLSAYLLDKHAFQINQYFNVFNWIGFFALGIICREANLLEKLQKNFYLLTLSILSLLLFIYLELQLNYDFKSYIGYTSLFVEISGIVLILIFSRLLYKSRILVDIGKKSFFIYLTHIQIVQAMNTRLPYNTFLLLFRPFIGLLVCYLLALLFNKLLKLIKLEKYSFLFGLN